MKIPIMIIKYQISFLPNETLMLQSAFLFNENYCKILNISHRNLIKFNLDNYFFRVTKLIKIVKVDCIQ